MGLYVHYRCPKCGESLEGWRRSYVATGPPLRRCGVCGSWIATKHVTEHALRNWHEKAAFWVFVAWGFVVYSVGVGLGGSLGLSLLTVIAGLAGGRSVGDLFPSILAVAGPIIAIVSGVLYLKGMRSDLQQSNKRMNSPEYRAKLDEAGLLPDWYKSKDPIL